MLEVDSFQVIYNLEQTEKLLVKPSFIRVKKSKSYF